MPTFRYSALDTKGQRATGELAAADYRQALAKVRELGYYPTAVDEAQQMSEQRKRRRISRADIALGIRQLANLIGAGLPMHRSLVVLSEQTANPRLRELVEEARAEVRAGGSLSGAFSRFPREFPPLAINLIRTGESTGNLGSSLSRLADMTEKSLQRRAQITSALIYPALLIVVALTAVIFLVVFLVPLLRPVLRDLGTSLPLPTILLLAIANGVRAGWWAALPVIAAVVLGLWYYSRRSGLAWWEKLVRVLPAPRRLMERIVTARFARTLGTLLAGGVAILDALEIGASGAGSTVVSEKIGEVREQVREGVPLATALERAGGFLPVMIHVSAVGEETGQLPDLLLRLADSLDFEVDIALRRAISVLEPAIILIMGIIVGFIVLAILLPIFSLGSAMPK